jgi:hypothetical protein
MTSDPDSGTLVVRLDDDPRAAARQVDDAAARAEATGCAVHLVRVIDPPSAGGPCPLATREALDALARRVWGCGVPVTSTLVTRRRDAGDLARASRAG